MQEFKRVPATKASLSQRKSVSGVGLNDAKHIVELKINGKSLTCPSYVAWRGMLNRCYSENYIKKHPTYKGCTVCDEWLIFSNFDEWYLSRYFIGCCLDKDIKVKGNKVYGPSTCLVVPPRLNALVVKCSGGKSMLPDGVTIWNRDGTIRASICIDGVSVYLGTFGDKESASKAYIKAKNTEILKRCDEYPEFSKYIINHLIK